MLNIFILEDDRRQLTYLQRMIQQISRQFHLQGVDLHLFQSIEEIRAALPRPSKENVFILDLEINGDKNAGLKFSQTIRVHDQLASIIFITVHDEMVYTTYKYRVSALDFIAKDRGNVYEELTADLRTIIRKNTRQANREFFTYKSYTDLLKMPLDNICYFASNSANSHSSMMHTADGQSIQVNYNLHEIEKLDNHFFRAHRSYLINPQQVKKIDFFHHTIEFFNGDTCPVSRRHEKKLLGLIKKSD